MVYNVLLIGAGNVGSRHLQGILRAKNSLYKKIIQFVEEFLSRLGETGFIFIYS